MYLAVKAHFTSDYDFFIYKGEMRSKITMEKFAAKNYYPIICKLANTYDSKSLLSYYVSNMLINDGQYMFDIDFEGKRIYNNFIRRKDSREYTFKKDLKNVYDELEKLHKYDFWDSIEITDGQHPLLFSMFIGGHISPETMCILFQVRDYLQQWDKEIKDTIIYPMVSKQIRKLSPFLMIKDHSPYTSFIDSHFNF